MRRFTAFPFLVLLLALGVLPSAYAGAQAARTLDSLGTPGTKLRLQLRSGEGHEGRLLALRADSLVATVGDSATRAFAIADIARLEVVGGRHRPVLRGAGIGAAVGGGVGAIVGALSYQPCTSTDILGCYLSPDSRAGAAGAGLLVGGVLGAVVGALQGLVPRDTWTPVALDRATLRVNLRPLRARELGAGLALAF